MSWHPVSDARPRWRGSDGAAYLQEHVDFNRWFRETRPSLDPPVTRLDTTHSTVEETAVQVLAWIENVISRQQSQPG